MLSVPIDVYKRQVFVLVFERVEPLAQLIKTGFVLLLVQRHASIFRNGFLDHFLYKLHFRFQLHGSGFHLRCVKERLSLIHI